MRQRDEADVVVLGGGPAGCAAALTLARQGHDVIVIERSAYDAPRIGETLPPMARQLLADLGVWDRFARQEHSPSFSICSAWGSEHLYENDFIFNPYGHGWHIDRTRFDEMLALAAAEAGADVRRGARLVSCTQHASGEWDLEIGAPAGFRHCRARFVIDASGRAASFARKQGARRTVVDHLIGAAAFLRASASPQDSWTLVEAVQHGWWYSARLPNAQLVMAYMTDADVYATRRRCLSASWAEQLRQAPHTYARAQDHSIAPAPLVFAANSSRLDTVAGRHWLAVGDAAMAFDPLSSQGVCQALKSGRVAAGLIHDHWGGDEAAISGYAQFVNRSFESFLSARNRYYGREKRWPQSLFWRRRHAGSPSGTEI
jgi:flavin-dependent dehydrogenase